MSKFSERFKELRQSRKLSQQELADKLNTSKSSVNMYERGEREPGIEMLETIADFFNVDMDYIYGKTDIRRRVSFDSNGDSYVYVPEFDPDHIELIDLYSKLTKEQKQTVMNMLRSFVV